MDKVAVSAEHDLSARMCRLMVLYTPPPKKKKKKAMNAQGRISANILTSIIENTDIGGKKSENK